jgi:hypothetical protein
VPGLFPPDVLGVVGDFDMAVLGVRQDLTYKVLDQEVITDDTGKVIFNLPQQDMVALRVTARFGYANANPVTRSTRGVRLGPYPQPPCHRCHV